MKKKYVLLVLIIFIFQVFSSFFLYAKAEENTSICAGPSETMSLYFDFQNEMRAVLLGSKINERRFSVYMGREGLFTKKILKFDNTPLELVADSVRNRRSFVSNTITTAVLMSLSVASVIQSNTDGIAILFRDRPIVRDYKTMLDIESELFDVAYFRSKQINLTRPLEGNLVDKFTEVVKKYQDLGLLDKNTTELKDNVSMSLIIRDLLKMNAAMKHFMVYDIEKLEKFRGCMSESENGNCIAVLQFSDEAIQKLKLDYQKSSLFTECNQHFKSLLSKTVVDSWKVGGQDVKDAISRLKDATVGWSLWNDRGCDISDYEMAQIRSYWGDNWTCDDLVNFQANLQYYEPKKSIQDLRKLQNGQDESLNDEDRSDNKVNKKNTTAEKKQEWFYIYGTESEYNPEYSLEMNDSFLQIYTGIKIEYDQSQWNAQSSNLSGELVKFKGLIDQVDGAIKQSALLKDQLEKIANYQAAN